MAEAKKKGIRLEWARGGCIGPQVKADGERSQHTQTGGLQWHVIAREQVERHNGERDHRKCVRVG